MKKHRPISMTHTALKFCAFSLVCAVMLLSFPIPSYGPPANFFSTNFSQRQVITTGGGDASDTARHITATFGGPASGKISSTSFLLKVGKTAYLVGMHDTVPPGAFTLLYPANAEDSIGLPTVFSWTAAADSSPVVSYRLIVDTDMIGNFVIDTTTFDTTIAITITTTDTYLWRVTATDVKGETRLVGDSTYKVDNVLPETPVLLGPINGTETGIISIRFDWTDAFDTHSGLKDYHLQVSDTDTFTSLLVDVVQTGLSETTPLTLFTTSGIFYWRVSSRDSVGNTSGFVTDTFTRPIANDTVPPLGIQGLTLQALETGGILLSWTRSPSADVVQYNIFYDSGSGVPADTLLAFVAHAGEVHTFVTNVLVPGTEYVFRVTAADTAGNQDSGSFGSAFATTFIKTTASASVAKEFIDVRLRVGDSAVPIRFTISGTDTQIKQLTTVTFQYKLTTDSTYKNMTAAALFTHNKNPIPLGDAKDRLGNFQFVWDASGLDTGDYQIRAFVTANNGDTDLIFASGIGVRNVDPQFDSPTLVALVTDSATYLDQMINANVSETVLITNFLDSQTAMITLPIGAFKSALDTTNVFLNSTLAGASIVDNQLEIHLAPVLDALVVSLSNGDTTLDTGSASITLSFDDFDQDGFVDNTKIRWNEMSIYTHSGLSGATWKKLTTSAKQDPTSTTSGWLRTTVSHFSIFRLVGPASFASLSNFMVTPNPFRPNDGVASTGTTFTSTPGTGIYFLNLPQQVRIEIYTITGARVFEFSTLNSTGQIQWDVQNDAGRVVASGVYLVVATDLATGERVMKKIAVIR